MNGGNVMIGKKGIMLIVFCITVLMFCPLTAMGGPKGKSGNEPPPAPLTQLLNPDVPRMSNLELASLIGDPKTVIIDVDKESHWDVGNRKRTTIIKGATVLGAAYFEPIDNIIRKYSRNNTYVLYCG